MSRVLDLTNNPDRYILECWGHYFHQRLAYRRGIENMLFDFYDNQQQLKRTMALPRNEWVTKGIG